MDGAKSLWLSLPHLMLREVAPIPIQEYLRRDENLFAKVARWLASARVGRWMQTHGNAVPQGKAILLTIAGGPARAFGVQHSLPNIALLLIRIVACQVHIMLAESHCDIPLLIESRAVSPFRVALWAKNALEGQA